MSLEELAATSVHNIGTKVVRKRLKSAYYTYNMHYGNIKKYDIANGEGVRVSLFVSGCRVNCKHCFQKETWDFNYGQEFNEDTVNEIIEALKPSYIKGLTVLGGEPFEKENQEVLVKLYRKVKEIYPQKSIWSFSGYLFDQDIIQGKRHFEMTDEILSYLDVLIDGPFINERKNISLAFRGSENQRVIDVPKSLSSKSVVLYLE